MLIELEKHNFFENGLKPEFKYSVTVIEGNKVKFLFLKNKMVGISITEKLKEIIKWSSDIDKKQVKEYLNDC